MAKGLLSSSFVFDVLNMSDSGINFYTQNKVRSSFPSTN